MNEENTSKLTTADLASASQEPDRSEAPSEREPDQGMVVTESNETKELLIPDSGAQQGRWEEIQSRFVDEPKKSVEEADGLVAEVIQQLASKFADERSKLESQWQSGGEASTEDLRLAMQHYRNFFQRLLAA